MKIRSKDNVIVTTGRDKGKTGTVSRVLPDEMKVVVEGLNKRKVHIKSRRSEEAGKIIEKEMPIHISNVMLIDSKTKKPTRVGFKVDGKKKVRISKKSNTEI